MDASTDRDEDELFSFFFLDEDDVDDRELFSLVSFSFLLDFFDLSSLDLEDFFLLECDLAGGFS